MSACQAVQQLGYLCSPIARRDPERIAYIELDRGAERLRSYGDLDRNQEAVARYLIRCGLGKGDKVAVGVGNKIEFVEILFGVMRAGLVPVPLNLRQGGEVLHYVVRDASCKAVFADLQSYPDLAGITAQLPVRVSVDLAQPGWDNYRDLLTLEQPVRLPQVGGEDIAMLPYTSGSTGNPKGVLLTHRGQCWAVDNYASFLSGLLDAGARALVAVPLFHKNAMMCAIKPLLRVGGSAVLMQRFDARDFIYALEQYDCTYTTGVPAMYAMLLQQRELLNRCRFAALRYLCVGSAPVAPQLLSEMRAAFGAPVVQSYGMTEGGPAITQQHPDDSANPFDSCGRLLPGVEARLVDEQGNTVSGTGELWVKNPGVTCGYFKQPELTAARLRDGWLATGDIMRVDAEGYYYFLGRRDDLMICGGENIYPIEIEKILLRHPAINNACVVALPDAVKGEVPAAMVVPSDGATFVEQDIQQFFLQQGPAYAHPRRVICVSQLPQAGTGKIDRRAVRAALLEDWNR